MKHDSKIAELLYDIFSINAINSAAISEQLEDVKYCSEHHMNHLNGGKEADKWEKAFQKAKRLVNNDETFNFDGYNWDGGKELIVEEFIKGREFSVTVLNNLVLEPVEIKSKNIFFDTEAKDNEEKTSYSFNTLSNEKNSSFFVKKC